MIWTSMDTWIVVAGALSAVACAIPGNFLVLRRMSMMGDAISHAVLPGLAIAFLMTDSRSGLTMFIGAAVVGLLTAVFTQWVNHFGKVEESASMGVVFTTLFAIGLVIIVRAADHVDLDPGCVLYGAIELVPLDTLVFMGLEMPRVVLTIGIVLIINLLFTVLFFKELRITSFDPNLAMTMGVNANVVHYAVMSIVAVTTVACFESVGSILVIAMLIVPPAIAYLLTDRLYVMVPLSAAIAVLCAVLGHILAIIGPGLAGFGDRSTNTAGMMAVVAGLIFVITLIFAPRHGVLSRWLHQRSLGLSMLREDVLGLIYRLEEHDPQQTVVAPQVLRQALGIGPFTRRIAMRGLIRAGLVRRRNRLYEITETGRHKARDLVRSHRLWESYLHRHADVLAGHVHPTAELLEHVTTARMQEDLAAGVESSGPDPHGKSIPPPV
jgi:manganese/zinc/iron transport system permease protein